MTVDQNSAEPMVLIVGDDENLSAFLQQTLEVKGIASLVAATGAQAVSLAAENGIALMTIDHSLPDMTGEEVISRLRREGIRIPFVMIIGREDEEIAVRSMKLGAREYLVKNENLFDRVPKVIADILDLLKAEAHLQVVHSALKDSEERFGRIFQHSGDGLLLVDCQGVIRDINKSGLQLLGYEHSGELAGRAVRSLLASAGREVMDEVLGHGSDHPAYRFEMELLHKDGSTCITDVSVSVLNESRERLFLLDFRDITAKARHLSLIRNAAEEWKATFDSTTDLVSVHDRDMRIIKANRAFSTFFGLPAGAIVGRKCYELFHPEDMTFDTCPNRKTIEEGEVVTREMYHQERGIPFLVTTSPIFDDEGGVAGAVHVAKDITSLKEATDEVRHREKSLADILNGIQDGITILDTDLRIVRANSFAEQKYASQLPLQGKQCYEVYQNRTSPCERCPSRRTLETKRPSSEILSFFLPNEKAEGWMEIYTYPVIDAGSGRVTGVIEYMKDITRRRQAEERVLESEEKYRCLFEEAIDAILVVDEETGVIVEANNRAEALTGIGSGELAGMDCMALLLPERRDGRFSQLFSPVRQEPSPEDVFQEIIVRRDNSNRDVNIKVSRIAYHGKMFLLCVLQDVTEQKKMSERLKQAQKLEAIGTLAAGIAHDFNNILTAILGFTDIIAGDIRSGRQVNPDDVEVIREAGERAGELVRQVLMFSRESGMEQKYIDITPIVKETMKFLKASLPSTINLEQNIRKISRPVFADPIQLHQVIMNLCTNAHHAMRVKGGTLSVILEEVTMSREYLGEDQKVAPGQYARISISDTGHGMDDLTLSRIFDPFFSTKSKNEGTGLGLSVVHGIVENHGGIINVYSKVNAGTTFRVYLPLAEEGSTDPTPVREDVLVRGGTESILLVDDEPRIAETGRRILSGLGYEVTSCTDSAECLDVFRSAPAKYDLVLTDLTMPKMTGLDLSWEIKRISPETRIVLMTGFAQTLEDETLAEYGIECLVKKPVLKNELARTIRSLLDQKG